MTSRSPRKGTVLKTASDNRNLRAPNLALKIATLSRNHLWKILNVQLLSKESVISPAPTVAFFTGPAHAGAHVLLPVVFRGRRQGRQPLYPARGPKRSLLSVGERGCHPYRRPCPPSPPSLQPPPQFMVFGGFPIFFDLVDQDGSTWPNISPKTAQHSRQMAQHGPQAGPT